MSLARLCAAIALLAWATATTASAYFLYLDKWPDGTIITMNLELGSAPPLSDGSADWDASATTALATWNQSIRLVQFNAVQHSSEPKRGGDGINAVYFAPDVYGMGFESGQLAATVNWVRCVGTPPSAPEPTTPCSATTRRVEADVIFNSATSWDSYGGRLRLPTYDFHRVALHEFGHVLGLLHPDDFGQTVVAQMNSYTSDLDVLASDDIAGAQALYGVSGTPAVGGNDFGTGTVMFPPRDESLKFREQLEAKYRDGLRRQPTATSVDIEGDIVWTQEYLRYRVNQCPHDDAIGRVMAEIDGLPFRLPAPPVCGASPVGVVLFPPRDDSYKFRTLLENKYYDGLGRAAVAGTTVDIEGDIVWTQEYLRYRVNGCGHGDAVQNVLVQIEGQPAPPVCH